MPAEALCFFSGTPVNASAADLIAFVQNIHKKGLFFVVAMPHRREPDPAPVEGKEITIIAGSCSGCRAQKSDTKGTTAKMARAIIDAGNGGELTARIKQKNIGRHLKKAAHHLAKCQIKDWDEACRLFMIARLEAQMEQEELRPAAAHCNAQFNQHDVNA